MTEMAIEGGEKLAKLARQLKETGDKGLQRELRKQLRTAAAPVIREAQQAAEQSLPHRGGLNAFVGAGQVRVQTSMSGRNARVRLRPRRGAGAERGRLRHPVFGNRDRWVTQTVKPGWFTATLEEHAPEVRQQLVQVIDDVARQLEA